MQQATELARQMVTRWGMSERLGPVTLAPRDGTAGGGMESYGFGGKPYGSATADAIDAEVLRILEEGASEATRLLRAHRRELDRLAAALLEHETLDEPAIRRATGLLVIPRQFRAPLPAVSAALRPAACGPGSRTSGPPDRTQGGPQSASRAGQGMGSAGSSRRQIDRMDPRVARAGRPIPSRAGRLAQQSSISTMPATVQEVASAAYHTWTSFSGSRSSTLPVWPVFTPRPISTRRTRPPAARRTDRSVGSRRYRRFRSCAPGVHRPDGSCRLPQPLNSARIRRSAPGSN
jgi:hypothetical protein